MEPAVKKVHFATIVAIVITTSIATHLLAVGALGPATPGFLIGLRSGAGGLFSRWRSLFSDWVAAARDRRERQAAIRALRSLNDRELKDIGLYRSSLSHDIVFLERERQAGVSGTASAFRANGRR
jgi:uncharacterized protein YjiS (DUF1127 family)